MHDLIVIGGRAAGLGQPGPLPRLVPARVQPGCAAGQPGRGGWRRGRLPVGQAFCRFGTAVSVVDEAPRLLRVADPRAAEVIAGVFRREGVDVRTGTPVTNAERDGDEVRLSLASGEAVRAERVLVGPRP